MSRKKPIHKHKLDMKTMYNGIYMLCACVNKLYLYTKDGSPSWITHNFSLNYDYNYFIKFNISIDNIFDIHYRTYSSGISAPGRNINLGLNFKF